MALVILFVRILGAAGQVCVHVILQESLNSCSEPSIQQLH